ncbi:MAG: hypothetical protein ACKPB0_07550, partial [Opitutaceae bacterium]
MKSRLAGKLLRRCWLTPLFFLLAVSRAGAAEPFTFAAMGCLPYARHAGSEEAFGRLIAEINRQKPAFAVHLGDILGSDERCSDELLLRRREQFDSVATALVYTPGDNEWTDTHSEKAGRFEPTERLARIRALFFAEERSRGRNPLPLITQRRDAAHARFVENARWTIRGVVFATGHLGLVVVVAADDVHGGEHHAAEGPARVLDEPRVRGVAALGDERQRVPAA